MIGTAGTAMLIAVLFAIVTMGLMRKRKMNHIMESVTNGDLSNRNDVIDYWRWRYI
ncbi:hypothetical protein UM764_00065 [Staphylococcus aureus]|nr:hypothetical protein UM764_00065 [Staphylococcus aureus]